jgi:hypothetical protein
MGAKSSADPGGQFFVGHAPAYSQTASWPDPFLGSQNEEDIYDNER